MAKSGRPLWRLIAPLAVAVPALVTIANFLASIAPRHYAELIGGPEPGASLEAFAVGSAPIVRLLLEVAGMLTLLAAIVVQSVFALYDSRHEPEGMGVAALAMVAGAIMGADIIMLIEHGTSPWVFSPAAAVFLVFVGRLQVRRVGWRRLFYAHEYLRLWPGLWLLGLLPSMVLFLGLWGLGPNNRLITEFALVVGMLLVPIVGVSVLGWARSRGWAHRFALSLRTTLSITALTVVIVVVAGSVASANTWAPVLRTEGRIPTGPAASLLLPHIRCVDVSWAHGPLPREIPATAIYLGIDHHGRVHIVKAPQKPIDLPGGAVVTATTDAERCLVQRGGSGRPQTRAMLANLV